MIAPDAEPRSNSPARRLLFVSPFVPDAGTSHGAGVAIGGLLGALACRHQVGLLHLRGPEEAPVPAGLAARLAFVHSVPRPEPSTRPFRRARLAIGLLRGRPMWTKDWWSPELLHALDATVRSWQPDVVNFELSVMAPYLEACGGHGAARVLTIHDPASTMVDHARSTARGSQRLMHALDARAWRCLEQRSLDHADAVVVFTQRDAEVVAQLHPQRAARVRVVPIGTDLPDRPSDPRGHDGALLFVGSSRHPPNVDAAQWLCASLMPGIVARVPNAELSLVGHHAPGTLPSPVADHIVLRGRVADVRAELQRAAVVVAPLRLGGGMRVKVLEALAAGKAVVATSAALAGTGALEAGAAVRADTDEEFVHAVARLLDNPALREQLARRAREHARRELAWPLRGRGYDTLYDELSRRATPRALVQAASVQAAS